MSFTPPVEIDNDYEVIEEGPASKVSRTWAAIGSHESQWVVVKSATVVRKFSKEPHDIAKELRILSNLSHPNIINVLSHTEDAQWSTLHFWMPFIPISLSDLLVSPRFSPYPVVPLSSNDEEAESSRRTNIFTAVTQSIMYQVLLALAYLHGDQNSIAHRDIKPGNILLTAEGCVKLIDFGIAWKDAEDADAKKHDLWPEYRPRLYFEVSTSPYRAPELLFGTRDYDAFALDLWSAGATFAEFFTPLRLISDEEDLEYDHGPDEEEEMEEEDEGFRAPQPFIMPKNLLPGTPETRWQRDTLFNGTRGELGLAWSIFKIRGTPTPEIWPLGFKAFEHLPDAKGVEFTVVPTVQLAPLLPNLPERDEEPVLGNVHFPAEETVRSSALDLVSRFLVYPSENRMKATRALSHPWFRDDILVPAGYQPVSGKTSVGEVEGKSLSQWLHVMLHGDL
ncbi:hypothetical protein D9615_000993 [Tricholomella constricta]|uniref:Protein kinase domain-containing protein n=1 Tax=Tricholomella constricta TaxID=117010 RepID=A0A8H5HL50_9AGAR|nr:hypothetical protein D9615_000993 [Tricholomella constricta]